MIEFYSVLLNNISIFIIILLLALAVTYSLFKAHIYSLFDPLLYFMVITESFCIAVVAFMGLFDIIDIRYVSHYMLTEVALFAGILIYKPIKSRPVIEYSIGQLRLMRLIFRVSFTLFVVLNLFIYSTRGIPLFVENRLVIYQVGGGIGIISRMFDVLFVVIVCYLLDVYFRRGWHWREWSVLIVVAIVQVLSGAKSALLLTVFLSSLYAFYTGRIGNSNLNLSRLLRKITLLAIFGFLIIAWVQVSDTSIDGHSLTLLQQMALRFVNNGDAFVYAYPGGLIERLNGSQPIAAIFHEYITFFRLIPPDELPMHIGLNMSKLVNSWDAMTQTNAKHNIFGYVNFGFFGGIFYSFILGILVGFARYKLIYFRSGSIFSAMIYVVINLGFISVSNEFDGTSRAIIGAVFILMPLAALTLILGKKYLTPLSKSREVIISRFLPPKI